MWIKKKFKIFFFPIFQVYVVSVFCFFVCSVFRTFWNSKDWIKQKCEDSVNQIFVICTGNNKITSSFNNNAEWTGTLDSAKFRVSTKRKLVETIEWFGCIYFFCLFVFLLLLFKKDGLTQMCLTFVAKKFFFVLMWGGGRRKKKKQKCKPNAVIISTNVSYLANGSVFPPKENLWIKICGKWNLTFDLHCTILSPL